MIMSRLTVFTVADRRYEPFVLPYMASVLHHNPDAHVEIALDEPLGFAARNADALAIIREHAGNRLSLRRAAAWHKFHSTQRFLLTPNHRSPFVYIGDIDILVLEQIADAHLAKMAATGLPYSNIQRHRNRLTGLHFSEWDAYYPPPPVRGTTNVSQDEVILCELVEDRGHPLPDPTERFRPTHGFHLSLNREPAKGWAMKSLALTRAYLRFRESDLWTSLFPLLDRRIHILMTILETGLGAHFPTEVVEKASLSLPRNWWGEMAR